MIVDSIIGGFESLVKNSPAGLSLFALPVGLYLYFQPKPKPPTIMFNTNWADLWAPWTRAEAGLGYSVELYDWYKKYDPEKIMEYS